MMKKLALIIIIYCSTSLASYASVVKEQLRIGPVTVELPYFDQNTGLQQLSVFVQYNENFREPPKPFSPAELIRIEATLTDDAEIEIRFSAAPSCNEALSHRDNASIIGRKCLDWDEGPARGEVPWDTSGREHVRVDFQVRFQEENSEKVKDFISQIFVGLEWNDPWSTPLYERHTRSTTIRDE